MEEQVQVSEKTNKFPKWLTTVTPFSKALAMILFIILPFVGFYLGMQYQQKVAISTPITLSKLNIENKINNSTVQNNGCDSADYYLKFLQQKFGSGINLKANNSEKWSLTFVYWKRKSTEPFIAYPEQVVSVNGVDNRSPEEINNIYRSSVDNSFTPLGYVNDPLNSFASIIPGGDGTKSWQYGYRKGNALVTVGIGPDQSTSNSNITSVDVGCGVENSKYDELYTELLLSGDVQAALKKAYGSNGLRNMIYYIVAIHQNDIVETGISSQDWNGGHSLWSHKDNGVWKAIYQGQNVPDCSTLESFHIESGVSCWDSNNPTHNTTR